MMGVNVCEPPAFAQAAIPHSPNGGRIILIGSGLGDSVPFPGVTAYAMSKSARLCCTRELSLELGPLGITMSLPKPRLRLCCVHCSTGI